MSHYLREIVREGVAARPDATLTFVSGSVETTYRLEDIHEQACRLAAGMQDLGLAPGDRVAMQMPNWVESIVTYVAAVELGLVIIPVVHIYGERELLFILEQSGARAVVLPDRWRGYEYASRVAPHKRPATLDHVIVVTDDAAAPDGAVLWNDLVGDRRFDDSSPERDDEEALIIYTSGTTGVPKGVLHTKGTLAAETAAHAEFFDRDDARVPLIVLPIGHMGGFLGSVKMFQGTDRGFYMDTWDAGIAARIISERGVTQITGTPFHILSLFDESDAHGYRLDSIGNFLLGSTSISPALVEAAEARGVRAYRMYGSSEHPSVTSCRPSDPLERRATTDGRPMPGVELRIVDEHDREVPTGEAGEILTRGPDLFAGYTDPAFNRECWTQEHWFRTGDIGVLDDDGYLTITDRKKDLIIRGGENIASKEVEDALLLMEPIREAAVVGVPDDRYGERVCAVLTTSRAIELEDVRRHFLTLGLARQKTPEFLVVTEQLPRTASGKVKKHAVRKSVISQGVGLDADVRVHVLDDVSHDHISQEGTTS